MRKYLLPMAALLLVSAGANAATLAYSLAGITYENTFAFIPTPVASCTGCGVGVASLDTGTNIITLTSISWYFNAGGNEYFTSFDGGSEIGVGKYLYKLVSPAPVCTNIVGTVCTPANVRSGMGGNFYTGIASDGTTSCTNGRCNVDAAIVGSDLVIAVRRALSESPTSFNSQTYTMTFAAVVPLPAGVWLFGSALGLMGFARRKLA